MPLSNKERQQRLRDRRALNDEAHRAHLAKERCRHALRRKGMSDCELKTHRLKVRNATRKWRESLQHREESPEHSSQEIQSQNFNSPEPYRSQATLAKARRKLEKQLPSSPSKQRRVVQELSKKVLGESSREAPVRTDSEIESFVKSFYQRDSVSRVMPGKADTVAIWDKDGKKTIHQKRHLLFTIGEAYELLKQDHPEVTIGKSKFASLRPPFVLLSSSLPHNVCGCKYHQNMICMLDSLHRNYPDVFPLYSRGEFLAKCVCDLEEETCMINDCDTCLDGKLFDQNIASKVGHDNLDKKITWSQWTAKETGYLEKVTTTGSTRDAIQQLCDLLPQFKWHAFLKERQSRAYEGDMACAQMEDSDSCLVQMDFSENYSALYQDEIASAYFGQKQITVYTVTMWYRKQTVSLILTSDVREHDKDTVAAFTSTILNIVESEFPGVASVIIWTDGPASQYKNKFVFALLPHLKKLHGVNIEWNYFATSHGKGPCDALGGNAKRIARRMVMTRRLVVKDASTFQEALKLSGTSIRCEVVSVSDVQNLNAKLGTSQIWEKMRSKQIPGTTNTHSVSVIDDCTVLRKYYKASEVGVPTNVISIEIEPDVAVELNTASAIAVNEPTGLSEKSAAAAPDLMFAVRESEPEALFSENHDIELDTSLDLTSELGIPDISFFAEDNVFGLPSEQAAQPEKSDAKPQATPTTKKNVDKETAVKGERYSF